MNNIERVDRAIKRIQKGWCQGVYARDKYGLRCSAAHDLAVSWCLVGSLIPDSGPRVLPNKIQCALEDELPPRVFIADWNDAPSRKRGDVLRLLRKVKRRLLTSKVGK